MPLTLNAALNATVVETPATGVPAIAANQSITQNGFNTALNLSATTTPTVTKDAVLNQPLTAGAATIDLTNLVGLNGAAVSFAGSKLRFLKAKAPAGNSAPITIGKGASNGYTGCGASFSVEIYPGGEHNWYDGGGASAVGSGSKTLDLAGTGTDSLNIVAVAGG